MGKNDDLELVKIMALFAEEFDDGKDVSRARIERWKAMLCETYGIEKLKFGAVKLLKTRKYKGFPRISEMIEAIEGSPDDLEEIALAQLAIAKKAISAYGSYVSVSFDDKVINKTIAALGSWEEWCKTPNEGAAWHCKNKDFIKYYCMFKKAYNEKALNDIPEYLPGIHGLSESNLIKGYSPRVNIVRTNHPTEEISGKCLQMSRKEGIEVIKKMKTKP